MVNDVMTQYANNTRIKEALAIAPNTSTLDTIATQANATARGTAKEMKNKITTVRMANDPISENGLPYGKTITIEHPSAGGLEAHNIEIWADDGVKVVSGKSQQLKTIDNIADVIQETTGVSGREARKTDAEQTAEQTPDQPTQTPDQPPQPPRVVADDFETVIYDDEIIFGRDAYTAREEIETVENLDQLNGDFTEEIFFIPEYMQGQEADRNADDSPERSHFAEDKREDTGHYSKHTTPPIIYTPTPEPPKILGYCVYPASLESQYLNKYVEF